MYIHRYKYMYIHTHTQHITLTFSYGPNVFPPELQRVQIRPVLTGNDNDETLDSNLP